MALPPTPRGNDAEEEIELLENCFLFSGDSLQYLKPFRVVDLDDGMRELTVRLVEDLETTCSGDGAAPGSVQTTGTIRVYFTPARPGHRYRCEFLSGSRTGRLRDDRGPLGPDGEDSSR